MRFNPSKGPWTKGDKDHTIYSANGGCVARVLSAAPPGFVGRPHIDLVFERDDNARLLTEARTMYDLLSALAEGDASEKMKAGVEAEKFLRRVRGA